MALPTDAELVRTYLAGDAGAFEALVSRYTDTIYRYLFRLCGDSEVASDVTQQTFVKVWKNLNRFREGEQFKTWIFTIARNSAYDWMRKRKSIPFSALDGPEGAQFVDTISDAEPLPDEVFTHGENAAQLENLLQSISPDNRDILLLHYVDDMTFDEIGKMRGEPLNTVKSRHRRALLLLREKAQKAPKTG